MHTVTQMLVLVFILVGVWGCDDTSPMKPPGGGGGAGDADSDADGDSDGDADGDADFEQERDSDCDNLLEITVRDFDESHPDMERADNGWGPVAGVLESTLGEDRKPVFANAMGAYTWKPNNDTGVMEKNCWDSGPGTPEECYMGTIPMFDGPESFADWYNDTSYNRRYEKQIEMTEKSGQPGVFIYDTSEFFPLSTSEGFGETPAGAGHNFLFTTEIHLIFKYLSGQKFTFRGDDDLWIFINGKMALDLGGLHLPFTGTIDFDAQAEELGIKPGWSYTMDIFHAERHTTQSNFRIETNIECFIPNPIEVE
ncbi:MAG: fibro-slime domain-containing protein [Deltaproteobacteria bacterium]|nr:fibro-slime domain-containing protein [Deltaproteobacteria bacterium]